MRHYVWFSQIGSQMCFKSGWMADTVMHYSPAKASLNILSGFKTEVSASKVEKSVLYGILYHFYAHFAVL